MERVKFANYVPLLLAATLFFVPISSSGKSILLSLAMIFLVLTPEYRRDLKVIISEKWCIAALMLFVLVLAGTLWSTADFSEKSLIVEKYLKLLYLPLLAVGFRDPKTRDLAIKAYLLAMVITALISFGKYFGIIHWVNPDADAVFHNHIMTSYMMAFAAFIALHHAFHERRMIYLPLIILFVSQLFIVNHGRTGIVVFAVLLLLFIMQNLSFKQGVVASLLLLTAVIVLYLGNKPIHDRFNRVVVDLKQYEHNDDRNTSIGYRLQFHNFARELFLRSPWYGIGTAGFTHAFAEEKPVPSWDRRLLEPHSNYWLLAAELGVAGIVSLLFLLGSLWIAALRAGPMRQIALGVLVSFMLANITDSFLLYSGTGYFFIIWMGLCMGSAFFNDVKK